MLKQRDYQGRDRDGLGAEIPSGRAIQDAKNIGTRDPVTIVEVDIRAGSPEGSIPFGLHGGRQAG
jgi:hypothetical protein